MMLPRLAIATATTPTGQTPAASGALASGRTPAAEVIANLRAEVLLRLVETMLKQLQRSQSQTGPANALLEILLDALKTMPAGSSERGEGLRDIAAILARVPAEARPAVERLLHKTIASLPTRILVEILRNPESPAAQKLASMIALLSAADADAPDVHPDRPRAIVALEAKLAESHTERRPFPRRENGLIGRGDARALQAELRRLFEPGAATRGSSGLIPADPDLPIAEAKAVRAAAALERAATAFPERQAEHGDAVIRPASAEAKADVATKDAVAKADTVPNRSTAASQVAVATAVPVGDGDESVTANQPITDAEEASPSPETRKETQAAAPVTSQAAVTARAKPEAIVHFITAVVASLSDDEAQLLKVLLERPIARTAPATGTAASVPEQQAEIAGAALPDTQETHSIRRLPDDMPALRAAPVAEDPTLIGERAALPAARETAAGQTAETRIDPALIQGALRETIVPAFVPYMPAQDGASDETQAEGEEDDRDEAGQDETGDGEAHEGEAGGEDGSGSQDGQDAQDDGTASEDPATLKKREKIADLVGPPDPGFVFYQKLGEYWA